MAPRFLDTQKYDNDIIKFQAERGIIKPPNKPVEPESEEPAEQSEPEDQEELVVDLTELAEVNQAEKPELEPSAQVDQSEPVEKGERVPCAGCGKLYSQQDLD